MKRSGRPKRWSGPSVVTSCRIPLGSWEWVKNHRGVEFSALLEAAIERARQEGELSLEARFVLMLRKYGLSDPQIAAITRIKREGVPNPGVAEGPA